MVVAIDGPAGVGKTTLSAKLSEQFGFHLLKSGEFYRAITYGYIAEGGDPNDSDALLRFARDNEVTIDKEQILLKGNDVTGKLHSKEVDARVAEFSSIVPLRRIINKRIREIFSNKKVIAEGRDMTTVLFPDAEIRIFLYASAEERAKRRTVQGTGAENYIENLKLIKERDAIDANKEEGSLREGEGVTFIDTTALTFDDIYERIESLVTLNLSREDIAMIEDEKKVTEEVEGSVATQDTEQTLLQEQYMDQFEDLKEGEVVEGVVIQVDDEHVYVNIGYKSEGRVPRSEYSGDIPAVGENTSVVLISKEGKNGGVIVSRKKAESKKIWEELRIVFDEKKPINGTISKKIKGGYQVDLGGGVQGFVPFSKVDIHRVEDEDSFIGLKTSFLVERLYSDKKSNIVLNRRGYLQEKVNEMRREFFETKGVGDVVEGTVKSFTSFGAFIDLGGIDGLLHLNDMSWGHATRPKNHVNKGEVLSLKIIALDAENFRINLSLKEMQVDPWEEFEEHFGVDDVVKGRVVKIVDYGIFVELLPGIEGLVHISELSWIKRIDHPKEVASTGDEVEVKILGYDLENKRVSLGMRQLLPNPWETMDEKYPIGSRITGRITKLLKTGALIEIEEGMEGFLHANDISWNKKIRNPASELTEGSEIEASVISVDINGRKIRLGIKQLTEDPWELIANSGRGKIVEGEIVNKTEFGFFVKIDSGLEGLVHKNDLVKDRGDDPDEALKGYAIGDKIKAVVQEVNRSAQKLSLSIRGYEAQEEKKSISQYLADDDDSDGGTVSLGDFIKDK